MSEDAYFDPYLKDWRESMRKILDDAYLKIEAEKYPELYEKDKNGKLVELA